MTAGDNGTGNNLAEQLEELEVLQSIYDGDTDFKCLNDHTFQYKFGNEGEPTTVLLEIKWPSDYPCILPIFGINAFYNNHLSAAIKSAILKGLHQEASKEIGTQLTYNIIEWARENLANIIESHRVNEAENSNETVSTAVTSQTEVDMEGVSEAKTKEKKEQMTKSQKRKEWNHMDSKGEKQRGHDWVDVIKHLSQTGSKPEPAPEVTTTANNPLNTNS